jgi:hypothetical protein
MMITEHYRRLAADYFCRRLLLPASASRRAEPIWVVIGIWQGASRALWGLSICAFDSFIVSVGKFGSTTEY